MATIDIDELIWNPETRAERVQAERFLEASKGFDSTDPSTHVVEF